MQTFHFIRRPAFPLLKSSAVSHINLGPGNCGALIDIIPIEANFVNIMGLWEK